MNEIDYLAWDRKVMSMSCCLTLAKAYHEQDQAKRVFYYTDLAEQYLRELLAELRGASGAVAER
jgi:hypothetical protein